MTSNAHQRYVTYQPNGTLDGCYLQVPPEDHAARMIVIDEAQAAAWVTYRANAARDGLELTPPAPPALPTESEYVAAILSMLDTKVQERRYFGILSACSYAASTNTTFKAEADACMAWRDAVWDKAYATLDQVTAGTIPQPTIAELLAMLPTMAWPS
jgi:hypothetical protein